MLEAATPTRVGAIGHDPRSGVSVRAPWNVRAPGPERAPAVTAAHVDTETIQRLKAARREYGEQCPAAQRLREILPADCREVRRSLAGLAEERRSRSAAAPVEFNVSENELNPTQRAELEHARSRATTSMVLGIIAIVLFGILALFSVPIGHKSRRVLSRYPQLKTRYGWTRATVGVVLGWIVIGGWLVMWIVSIYLRWAIWDLFS